MMSQLCRNVFVFEQAHQSVPLPCPEQRQRLVSDLRTTCIWQYQAWQSADTRQTLVRAAKLLPVMRLAVLHGWNGTRHTSRPIIVVCLHTYTLVTFVHVMPFEAFFNLAKSTLKQVNQHRLQVQGFCDCGLSSIKLS